VTWKLVAEAVVELLAALAELSVDGMAGEPSASTSCPTCELKELKSLPTSV
jgi:hypothetical protein